MHATSRNVLLTVVTFLTLQAAQPAMAREIPVYPGAKLEFHPGVSEAGCCSFSVNSGLSKVLRFYETAFQTPALDSGALGTEYPEFKPQLEQLEINKRRCGNGYAENAMIRFHYFVLDETSLNGQRIPELFEVLSGPEGMHFTVIEHQLTPEDAHYADEWRERMDATSGKVPLKPCDSALLIAALPTSGPADFTAGTVYSGDAEIEGSPSSASVLFFKQVSKGNGRELDSIDKKVQLRVSITDYLGNFNTVRRPEWTVIVRDLYPGKESVETNSDGCVKSAKDFLVKDRYFINVRGVGVCDLAMLDELINQMAIDKLP